MVTSTLHAGITGDNVIVVVNSDSVTSRTIANHYVELRSIPSSNVVMLQGVPTGLKISLDDFKSKILTPILSAVNSRGLAAQARVIAYSADFPTSVDIAPHQAMLTDPMQKKYQTPIASINSATFFYRLILADDASYLSWYSNLYARSKFERYFINPFAGEKGQRFHSAKLSLAAGQPAAAAQTLRDLFTEFPTLASIGVMAAEAFAKADHDDNAKQMLAAAIRSGWASRNYLNDSEYLAPLLDHPIVAAEASRTRDFPTMAQYPIGFSSTKGWTSSGDPVAHDAGGMPYLLSCSLAVIHETGSTLDQAIAVLQRAATADRTFPQADLRFAKTSDVRTTTRFPGIADALVWLGNRNFKTEVFTTPISQTPGECVGMQLGSATLDLSSTKFKFVPGAIAENLTSLGAAFETPQQSKLTALLHAGVAMSSGAVAEPYSLQPKFPLPVMYAYYIEGVSAIEAFYLSTTSPYQLLIVGDPVTQPYAKVSGDLVRIKTDGTARQLKISRQVLPGLDPAKYQSTHGMEIHLNGRLVAEFPPQATVNVNLPEGLRGVVDVRVVLVSDPILESRITHDARIELPETAVQATITTQSPREITVQVSCDDAEQVELYHHGERIGHSNANAATFEVSRDKYGDGPLRLEAVAIQNGMPIRGQRLVVSY